MNKIITNNGLRPIASYLAHHGIKGQEWYHRRYQNYDGSYTEAGRLRYGIGKGRELKNNVARRKTAEKLIKYSNKASKLQQNAHIKSLKNPNAQTINTKKEQKAEELRKKQYEKAHELISESEKLHSAIDAYDVAEDRYEAAIDSFLNDKEAYSKVVDAQIEEDRKHGFYGGTEEDFREFYNDGEGQQAILERYELSNPELRNLWSDVREKEKAFEDTARGLYDDTLSIFGNFEVDRRKILGKGPYTLSEELAEREVHETLHGKRDAAKKITESEEAAKQTAKSEKPEYIDKVETKNGDTRYFYDKSELKAYKDGKSGATDKDLDDAFKKMRNSSKTDEEKDLKEHYWTSARDNDRWDINFLEAVQNSAILERNDKKSLLTEYAKYMADPSDYWENGRHQLEDASWARGYKIGHF